MLIGITPKYSYICACHCLRLQCFWEMVIFTIYKLFWPQLSTIFTNHHISFYVLSNWQPSVPVHRQIKYHSLKRKVAYISMHCGMIYISKGNSFLSRQITWHCLLTFGLKLIRVLLKWTFALLPLSIKAHNIHMSDSRE